MVSIQPSMNILIGEKQDATNVANYQHRYQSIPALFLPRDSSYSAASFIGLVLLPDTFQKSRCFWTVADEDDVAGWWSSYVIASATWQYWPFGHAGRGDGKPGREKGKPSSLDFPQINPLLLAQKLLDKPGPKRAGP